MAVLQGQDHCCMYLHENCASPRGTSYHQEICLEYHKVCTEDIKGIIRINSRNTLLKHHFWFISTTIYLTWTSSVKRKQMSYVAIINGALCSHSLPPPTSHYKKKPRNSNSDGSEFGTVV